MNNFSTASDYNFLAQGLSLYESLLKTTKNFRLHYLCSDEKSFKKLSEYSSNSLIPYSDKSLLENNETLRNIKDNDRKYYNFVLSSYFSNYLIKNFYSITYLDADIYFHQDIKQIFNEIKEKDIGIFRHRQFSTEYQNENGWFNVGVVYFKNSNVGRNALSWWSDAVLNRKYKELATCGDQKYLDAFVNIDRNSLFIDGNIGHGAPWQWMLYNFESFKDDGCIIWEGKKQNLVFSHFSDFIYNIVDEYYIPGKRHGIFTPPHMYKNIEGLKMIHDEYFNQIKIVHEKYDL